MPGNPFREGCDDILKAFKNAEIFVSERCIGEWVWILKLLTSIHPKFATVNVRL